MESMEATANEQTDGPRLRPTEEPTPVVAERSPAKPQPSVLAAAPVKSITLAMADRFGMDPRAFEATILATVMPKGATRENVASFLVVAHEYKLNPFTREIFAFEGQGGGIRPIVSVDGWAKVINSHPQFDGMELVEIFEEGEFLAVEARMFRKDRSHPTVIREWLVECQRDTAPWKKWPRRMLRHKAMIQCARLAFNLAGIEDEDEYERLVEASHMRVAQAPTATVTLDLTKARAGVAVDPPGGQAFPKKDESKATESSPS